MYKMDLIALRNTKEKFSKFSKLEILMVNCWEFYKTDLRYELRSRYIDQGKNKCPASARPWFQYVALQESKKLKEKPRQ
jgi:hypothetical protein